MSHHIKIHVENDTLVLRGSPEESVGCVLRGCLILQVKETIKVKSITMNLTGKMKVQWSERNHQHKKELVILEHGWTFLSNQKKLHLLTPNVYKYPFEYVLPGNLAESIDSNSYGSLLYKLKATVDRPAFSPNLIDRQLLRIVRQCTPSYHSSNIPLQIANEWASKIDYKITVPKRVFSRGEQIPIDFVLKPKLNCDQLRVRYLSCFLKEYTSFVLGGTHIHTESRIIRFFRDETWPSQGSHWHKSQKMTVPHSFESIQCDLHNQFFKIEHKLKFTMSFINQHGDLAELRATMPIEIINQQLEQQENELPTYENAWRSVLYSPVPYLDSTSYSPMEDPSPSTPHTVIGGEDYFGYQPPNNSACLLPSYHSAIVTADDDGLPAYTSASH